MKNDFLKIKRLFYCCLKKKMQSNCLSISTSLTVDQLQSGLNDNTHFQKKKNTNNDNFNSIKCTDADEILESLCIDLFALE